MGKIKFYGLEEFVMQKLFKEGYNPRQVSEAVLLEKGITISYSTIEVFRKQMLKLARGYLIEDSEYGKKVLDMQLNTMEMMHDTLYELQEKIDQFETNPKAWPAHLGYLKEKIKILYLAMKKNKEIGPEIQVNKVSVMNINNAFKERVMELIDYLLSTGVNLEQFPPEWQELYRKAKGMYAYA